MKKISWIILFAIFVFVSIAFEDVLENAFDRLFENNSVLAWIVIILLLIVSLYVTYKEVSKRCKIDPVYKARIMSELKDTAKFLVVLFIIFIILSCLFCYLLFKL